MLVLPLTVLLACQTVYTIAVDSVVTSSSPEVNLEKVTLVPSPDLEANNDSVEEEANKTLSSSDSVSTSSTVTNIGNDLEQSTSIPNLSNIKAGYINQSNTSSYKQSLMHNFAIRQEPIRKAYLQVSSWKLTLLINLQPYFKFINILDTKLAFVKQEQKRLIANYKSQLAALAKETQEWQNATDDNCVFKSKGCVVGMVEISKTLEIETFQACGKLCSVEATCTNWYLEIVEKVCHLTSGTLRESVGNEEGLTFNLYCGTKEFTICSNMKHSAMIYQIEQIHFENMIEMDQSARLIKKLGARMRAFLPEFSDTSCDTPFHSKCFRTKRKAPLRALGDALKAVTGVSTMADINQLKSRLENVEELTDKYQHFSRKAVTLYFKLFKSQETMEEAIGIIGDRLKIINIEVEHTEFRYEELVLNQAFNLRILNVMSDTRESLNKLITHLLSEIQVLENLMSQTRNNRLSSLILSPNELKGLLKEIAVELTIHKPSLVYWPEEAKLFYSSAKIGILALEDSQILMELDIPLRLKSKQYILEQFRSFPLLAPDFHSYSTVQFPDFIVHDSRQYVSLTEKELFEECEFYQGEAICKLFKPLKVFNILEPSDKCLLALISHTFGPKEFALCDVDLQSYTEPIFQRILGNTYFYAVNQSQQFIVDCYDRTDSEHFTMLAGSGQIMIRHNCATIIENRYSLYGINTFNSSQTHVFEEVNVTQLWHVNTALAWDGLRQDMFNDTRKFAFWSLAPYERLEQLHIIESKVRKNGKIQLKELKRYIKDVHNLPRIVDVIPFGYTLFTSMLLIIFAALFCVMMCEFRSMRMRMTIMEKLFDIKANVVKNGYKLMDIN
jgi:hypothetical protein